MSSWEQARNILAVRLDNTGDVIMLGPALRAVKQRLPAARITLLASSAGASAAGLLPWVDGVILCRAVWQDLGGLSFQPDREWRLIVTLAEGKFDAAIIFTSFSQTPHAPGYACYLAGIPLRAGESKEFGGSILTTCLAPAPNDLHQTERNLRLVEALGFPAHQRNLHVQLPQLAQLEARHLMAGVGIDPLRPFVLLHPGASAAARRYPPQRLGVVARHLLGEGLQVLIGGSERDRPHIEAMLAEAPDTPALARSIDLATYAAMVDAAAVVVCGNTLPLHLAEALRTPVVVLYSGTDLESQWRPRITPSAILRRDTACHPCYLIDCPIGQPCLDIPPAEVAAAVLGLLGSGGWGVGGDCQI